MFAEELARFELVLEDFGKVFDVFAGSGGDAVFFDGMRGLVAFAYPAGEEAVLAQVDVEAAQTAITHADDGKGLAGVAFGLMLGRFRRRHPMQNGQPDERLGLAAQPIEKFGGANLSTVLFSGMLQAAADRRLDVGASEGGDLAQLTRQLDAVVQQQPQLPFVDEAVVVGDAAEDVAVLVVQMGFAHQHDGDFKRERADFAAASAVVDVEDPIQQ